MSSNNLGSIYATTISSEKYIIIDTQNIELSGNVIMKNKLTVSNGLLTTNSIIPNVTNSESLGSTSNIWRNAYIRDVSVTNIDVSGKLNVVGATKLSNSLEVSGNVTFGGSNLYVPSSFTIDPIGHGDNTGTVLINGNLVVQGVTTTINSSVVDISDKMLVLASNASSSLQADGAGFEISGAKVNFLYNNSSASFRSSIGMSISGNVVPVSNSVGSLGSSSLSWSNAYIRDVSTTNIEVSGNIVPLRDMSSNLGSSLKRWNNVFVDDLSVNKINGQAYSASGSSSGGLSLTNISGDIIFNVSGGAITNVNKLTAPLSINSITTTNVIYQELSGDTSWNNVNGFYGLAKHAYPALNPYSIGEKVVSAFTLRETTTTYTGVCWSPKFGLFVSTYQNKVITSPDGINWTMINTDMPNNNYYGEIIWCQEAEIFVIASVNNTMLTSSNLINWNITSIPNNRLMTSVCWAPELRLIIAGQTRGSSIVTSHNGGASWNQITIGSDNVFLAFCWSAELKILLAITVGGLVYTSRNGIDWTTQTSIGSFYWTGVCWSKQLRLFVAVNFYGPPNVRTSPDGIIWTTRNIPSPDRQWNNVIWAPEIGLFIAVASNATNQAIITSPNGINWTTRNVPARTTNPFYGNLFFSCWSPELGIFVIKNDYGYITSSFKGRLPTSYNVFDSSFNNIDENGNWNFLNLSITTANIANLNPSVKNVSHLGMINRQWSNAYISNASVNSINTNNINIPGTLKTSAIQETFNILGQIIPAEGTADKAGWAVAINYTGDIIAIGAPFNTGAPVGTAGLVRVYRYISPSWVQMGLDIDGEANNDRAGWSLSLSSDGTIVAIGAPYNDATGENRGHVRIYKWTNNTSWIKQGQDIDGGTLAYFSSGSGLNYNTQTTDSPGTAVSLSSDGNIVAIGASSTWPGGQSSGGPGYIKVYRWTDNTTWVQIGTDISGINDQGLGHSVSLNSDGTVVGFGSATSDAVVQVYKWNNVNWIKRGSNINPEATDDFAGSSVSINALGDIIAIGARGNNSAGSDVGHVRVYKWTNDMSWIQQGLDIDGDTADEQFGTSVSLNAAGTILAVGSPLYDGFLTNSGCVKVYKWDNVSWVKQGTNIEGLTAGEKAGWAVALNGLGTRVVIGSPFALISGTSSAGYSSVYEYSLISNAYSGFGNITPFANNSYTLGTSANRWNNAFINDLSVNTINGQAYIGLITNSINTTHIQDGSILGTDISSGTISATQIANTTITSAQIANTTITAAQIANTTITAAQIANTTITAAQIANTTITAAQIANTTITAAQIANTTITAAQIANTTITGTQIANTSITSDKINQTNNWTFSQLTSTTSNIRDVSTTNIEVSGNIVPLRDMSSNLGSSLKRWNNVFVNDLSVNTINGQAYSAGGGSSSSYTSITSGTDIGSFNILGAIIQPEGTVDLAGYSVAMNDVGDVIAIGAPRNIGPSNNSPGQVRVYYYNGTSWIQRGLDIDGEGSYNRAGASLSMNSDGTIIAIGAPDNNGANGQYSGHVRVYKWNNTSWIQQGQDIDGELEWDQLSGVDLDYGPSLGLSLNSDGTIVAVGAWMNWQGGIGGAGHVRVYKYTTTWTQIGLDIDGKSYYEGSGFSVSLNYDGTLVAVGAPQMRTIFASGGNVRIYKWTGSIWQQRGMTICGEAIGDTFGSSVSLNAVGDILAFGGSSSSPPGTAGLYYGQVRVYKWINDISWVKQGQSIYGRYYDQRLGVTVALSSVGDIVAIGSSDPYDNNGEVIVYKWNAVSFLWEQYAHILSNLSQGETFGRTLALNAAGNRLIVGAMNASVAGQNSAGGYSIVYQYSAGSASLVSSTITPSVNNTYALGRNNMKWNYGYFSNIITDYITVDYIYSSKNIISCFASLVPTSSNSVDLGTSTRYWQFGRFNYVYAYSAILPFSNNTGYVGYQNQRFAYIYTTYLYVNDIQVNSDDRLKHNEVIINNGLDVIDLLTPKFYQKTIDLLDAHYNGDLSGHKWSYESGLIAQEVLQISDLSFAVSGGDYYDTSNNLIQQPYSVNYNNVFVYGLAAIKELHQKVKAQETSILEQQTIINSLIARIEALETNQNQ